MQYKIKDASGRLLYILEYEDNGDKRIFNRHESLLGEYDSNRGITIDRSEIPNVVIEGDHLISLAGIGSYYVYALIDPTEPVTPFYIGKGKLNRVMAHGIEANGIFRQFNANADGDQEITGIAPGSIVSTELVINEDNAAINPKIEKIHTLRREDVEDHEMARVLFRRVSENAALAIESCLINSCYNYGNGDNCLTNRNRGNGADRFRTRGDWAYKVDFDEPYDEIQNFSSHQNHRFGDYYVYVLRNPDTNSIFYVGKGSGNRLSQHFRNARQHNVNEDQNDRLQEIRALLDTGKTPKDIGRIVARVDNEGVAFMLETLWIKFIVGSGDLANIVAGHHKGLCRTKGDWEKRQGFDIPSIIEPGEHQSRKEMLGIMVGENLDRLLYDVRDNLCGDGNPHNLEFEPASIKGASELVIECPLINNNVILRIHTRSANTGTIQVALVTRNEAQKIWFIRHFRTLEAYPVRRNDKLPRFSPNAWGEQNLATTVEVAANRARQLIQIACADSRHNLPDELLALLEDHPPMSIMDSGQCQIRIGDDHQCKIATYTISVIYVSETAKNMNGEKWGSQVAIYVQGQPEPIFGRVDPWSGSYHDALRACRIKLAERNISLLVAGMAPNFIPSPDNPCYGSINNENVHMMQSWGVCAD